MNLSISKKSLWVRLGRYGLQIGPAAEQYIECWTRWSASFFGVRVMVLVMT